MIDGWEKFQPLRDEPTLHDAVVSSRFLDRSMTDVERYGSLFKYFLTGFRKYRSSQGSRVQYPGYGSIRGYDICGLEGFARTAPLLAAWLYRGCSARFGKFRLDMCLRDGLLAGTDPSSPEYWGDIGSDDQRLVEAADIARAVWLSRKQVWSQLDIREQSRIAAWLSQACSSHIRVRNNWLLFPVVVEAALTDLGHSTASTYGNYWEFKEKFYRQNGWFFDLPEGVDFYNTWGIGYDLFWLHLLAPALDAEFLRIALLQSGRLTAHLISPAGVPIMGRSVCYRTAVPCPVLAAAHVDDEVVSPGMARRSLDAVWRYFVTRGALRQGSLTMGYFDNDPRLIDDYTGPGSSHWGLRSLVLAYMFPDGHSFWQSDPEHLPIEKDDFCLALKHLGWTVRGFKDTQNITITIAGNARDNLTLEPQTDAMRRDEASLRAPVRPKNHAAKYEQRTYQALYPFPDDSWRRSWA